MKKTLFALFAVASILTFASCNNTDDENGATNTTTEDLSSLTTGSQIQIDGVNYYVVKNNLSSENSSSSRSVALADEIVSTGDTNTDDIIKKFASDEYVQELLNGVGITEYLQTWDAVSTNYNEGLNNSYPFIRDRFVILGGDKKAIAYFDQLYTSDLGKNLQARGLEGFAEIENNDVARAKHFRDVFANDNEKAENFKKIHLNYEPNRFDVETLPDNLQDKKKYRYTYIHDSDGNIETTKEYLKSIKINKDYRIVSGAIKNLYVYQFDDNDTYKTATYVLDGTGEFYELATRDYTNQNRRQITVRAKGTAPFGDENGNNKNNDSKKYQDSVNISFNPSSITITKQVLEYIDDSVVNTGKTVSINLASGGSLAEQSISTSGFTSTATTLGEVISEFSDNIRFSSEPTELNGYTVPSKIYIRAIYPNSFTNCAFLKDLDVFDVVLVPDTSKTTGIFYREINRTNEDDEQNIPSFVQKYSEVFPEVFARTYNTKSTVFTSE